MSIKLGVCLKIKKNFVKIILAVEDPILAYLAGGEVFFLKINFLKFGKQKINQVCWSSTLTDWISICYDKNLELLRV